MALALEVYVILSKEEEANKVLLSFLAEMGMTHTEMLSGTRITRFAMFLCGVSADVVSTALPAVFLIDMDMDNSDHSANTFMSNPSREQLVEWYANHTVDVINKEGAET